MDNRLYRVSALLMALLFLLGGCTAKYETKKQLMKDGAKLVLEKNPSSAIILFRNALEKDQNCFEARFQLAKIYNSRNYEVAEKELQKIRKQNPSSRDVQIELARVMAYTNRLNDAQKELSTYKERW